MNTANDLKERISSTIDTLPESSLLELAAFLEYLEYRESVSKRQTPYKPVALGGLWKGATITDEDIAEVRREMWETFGEEDE